MLWKMREYLDDADNVSVEVTVYSVGNPDVESTDLGPEFYEYVQEHFAAIEKRADVLESRRYKLAVEIESDREIFEEEPEISELDKAKKYISDFLENEYRTELSEDNFKDMSHIAIGYTTTLAEI